MDKGSTKRVLLVSEEKRFDFYLTNLLQNQFEYEFEIDQIYPIERAIAEITSGDYDLVILDVKSGEDCSQVAEKICKAGLQLPIVVLSSHQDKNDIHAYKQGVQQIINKASLDPRILTHTILSAIDRKTIENEIHMRDEILKAVNSAAEIFLTDPNWESNLSNVLSSFGKATRSDRVYIFKNSMDPQGNLIASYQAGWVAKDPELEEVSLIQDFFEYEKSGFQRWIQQMQNNEMIYGNVEEMPAMEQPLLMRLDIKSFIRIPIFIDHTWWGFIGFDQCSVHNCFYEVEIDTLRTAAKILGAAISRQVTEEKLTYLATHDYLTNLPNRMLFEDRFQQAIARSMRNGRKFAVISLDMDKFKLVNDSYGHQIGDEVLIEVGKRLLNTIRGTDTCARIGGDEFAVIAEEINNKGDVMRVMEKICIAMQPKIDVEQHNIQGSASMGASIYPIHGTSMEELLKAADKALYYIKGSTARFKVYSDDQISWLND